MVGNTACLMMGSPCTLNWEMSDEGRSSHMLLNQARNAFSGASYYIQVIYFFLNDSFFFWCNNFQQILLAINIRKGLLACLSGHILQQDCTF